MSSGNAPPHKWLFWRGTLPDDTKNGGEADSQVTAILKLSMKCSKAQFKRQNSHVMNLLPIQVDPNETGLTLLI